MGSNSTDYVCGGVRARRCRSCAESDGPECLFHTGTGFTHCRDCDDLRLPKCFVCKDTDDIPSKLMHVRLMQNAPFFCHIPTNVHSNSTTEGTITLCKSCGSGPRHPVYPLCETCNRLLVPDDQPEMTVFKEVDPHKLRGTGYQYDRDESDDDGGDGDCGDVYRLGTAMFVVCKRCRDSSWSKGYLPTAVYGRSYCEPRMWCNNV